ncbi:MAG: tripartite tricarboxylate transporter substrate binding protein [Burkholderiales bacterium]|nr:tripartite tricarboxylate transporter substrate binding protein [Burkholderiales bacterium]
MERTLAMKMHVPVLSAAALAVLLTGAGNAQPYPDKPVRLVVGSAPGGGNDFVARVVNARLSELLGKQVIIDNRGGAGGLLGTEIVAHASPDGYTLLQMFSNFAILPSLHPRLTFDVERDFAPIVNVASTALILVVHPGVPANSVSELIAYAKRNPDALNFAAPGVGSLGHLAGELFKSMAKVNMTHVAYKGGGPAIAALVGREVHLYFSTVPAALAQVKAGRLRALGVTSPKRLAAAPAVPTIAEQGLRGFDVVGWFGMFAPARAPSAVVELLNDRVNKSLAAPEVKERLASEGVEPEGGTPVSFANHVKREIRKWNAVARQAGVVARPQ